MKRTTWALAGAAVLVTATVTGGVAAASGSTEAAPATQDPASTATVQKGKLAATVSLDGILTYRNPYSAINHAAGTYTALPGGGDKIGCGDVFYRVDDRPVLLLCGPVPAYRDLRGGDTGNDVRELNENLRRLGYPAATGSSFTARTRTGLRALQHDRGAEVTGELGLDDAVVLPEPVRIAKVSGVLGAAAQPGAPVVQATSDTLEVRVTLDALQQGLVKAGCRARITLPGNRSATGRVARLGRVAQVPDGQQTGAGGATVPAYLGLDDPAQARGLDQAPVQVEITTAGVDSALNVPVTALVGKSGGGFAVEVVRAGGARALVAVEVGLFDSSSGQVQVEGDLHEGDHVVVPAS
ncbi:peptidoglycan-binding protein [Actinoplanes sp. KI2]|uniref:peptidoglycan-binding protein n=1 Tax=Actinoplanes sp. KI2 TaxID=2983315 RepID=UPI0021D5FEE5|nr:peptidoglycan-binding protein [Actinoplanes sp. KI2]MCU7724241.1 peptidoglycan-binding protein [Actinoplanes sp. KI2]